MNEPKRMADDQLARIKSWLAERLPISKSTCELLNGHLAVVEAELADAKAECSWLRRDRTDSARVAETWINIAATYESSARKLRGERDELSRKLEALSQDLAAAQAEISEWKHRAVGGTCRALSEGSECQCSLCARDRHIAELEAALAASKAECSRLIAVRDAADARVRRLDEELYDQKRLRESEAAVACSVWRAHEQQFEAQQARLVEALAHIERLRTCVIDESSSRVCRLGTRGCVNTHDEERQ